MNGVFSIFCSIHVLHLYAYTADSIQCTVDTILYIKMYTCMHIYIYTQYFIIYYYIMLLYETISFYYIIIYCIIYIYIIIILYHIIQNQMILCYNKMK